jgi:hypothetical protein
VSDLDESNLAGAAIAGFNGCIGVSTSGFVSAVVRDVFIQEVCLVQCLSNRATGCPSS